MKASELRIGNYYDFSNSGQIEQIKGKDIYEFECDPIDDIYYPIRLTKEWLLKFGFEMYSVVNVNEYESYDRWVLHNVVGGTFEVHIIHSNYGGINETEIIYSIDNDERMYFIENTNYVHVLQNTFALTGEELKTNEL